MVWTPLDLPSFTYPCIFGVQPYFWGMSESILWLCWLAVASILQNNPQFNHCAAWVGGRALFPHSTWRINAILPVSHLPGRPLCASDVNRTVMLSTIECLLSGALWSCLRKGSNFTLNSQFLIFLQSRGSHRIKSKFPK